MRQSGVNGLVSQGERVLLPRLLDLVRDAVALSASCHQGETVTALVVDIEGAFHNVPHRASEKRFVCAQAFGAYYIFDVSVFGAKSAPTIWGRFAAWLGRSMSSLFDPSGFRVQIYVDDPAVVVRGNPAAI